MYNYLVLTLNINYRSLQANKYKLRELNFEDYSS